MTDLLDTAMNDLVPSFAAEQPDWTNVVARSHVVPRRRLVSRRHLVVALVVVAAVLIPLAALADANDWWFFRTGLPVPTSAPVVVTTGEWSGHPWELVAYPSESDGLCFSITPKPADGSSYGGAMTCGPFVGVPRTAATKVSGDMQITFLSGSWTSALPAYIAGPVIEQATTVAIRFEDGKTLRAPTVAAPHPLEHIRFYAAPLPLDEYPAETLSGTRHVATITWLAGLDASGRVVACLAPATAKNGVSPLTDCR
jgi:hypothetical protein